MIRLAIVAAFTLAQPGFAQAITGTASAVDGDSLTVGGQDVRLFGIDAPEYRQTCQVHYSAWTCGADAAAALRKLVDNRLITCISRDRDVYGRTVANCLIDGHDVAAQTVREGLAIVLDNGRSDYGAVEAQAKAGKIGVWASQFAMPVDWRRAHPRDPAATLKASARLSHAPARPQPQSSGNPYRSCAQARAAGATPVYRGQPGYNPNLDGDADGIACEPYRRRR